MTSAFQTPGRCLTWRGDGGARAIDQRTDAIRDLIGGT